MVGRSKVSDLRIGVWIVVTWCYSKGHSSTCWCWSYHAIKMLRHNKRRRRQTLFILQGEIQHFLFHSLIIRHTWSDTWRRGGGHVVRPLEQVGVQGLDQWDLCRAQEVNWHLCSYQSTPAPSSQTVSKVQNIIEKYIIKTVIVQYVIQYLVVYYLVKNFTV